MEDTAKLIQELSDAALGRTARPGLVPTADRAQLGSELAAIEQYGAVDRMPSPSGTFAGLKRFVLRVAAFNWERQRAVNHASLGSFRLILDELEEIRARLAQTERRMAASATAATDDLRTSVTAATDDLRQTLQYKIDSHETVLRSNQATTEQVRSDLTLAVESVGEGVNDLRARVSRQEAELAALRSDLLAAETSLLVEQRRVAALRTEIARARIAGFDDAASTEPDKEPVKMHDIDELYARFEAAFRPSTQELIDRFDVYLTVIESLRDGQYPIIDVGAGRGEFVDLLAQQGFPCRGIDLSADAVAEAQERGRPVELAEAITYLAGLESETVGAVTMFHLVEHLEPPRTLRLLDECLRVIKPGGFVIIETPNPTNLNVGAAAFYHDPSHLRPVTPTYLEFMVRDVGFTDVTTRFLHPLPEYALELAVPEGTGAEATRRLLDDVKWALKGPQDFAVIARRPAGS